MFEVSAEVGADEMAEQAELAARLSQNNVLAANNAPPDLATYDHQFSRFVIEIYTPNLQKMHAPFTTTRNAIFTPIYCYRI